MVSGDLTLGMTRGRGARAISGPKKRQPKRSFSTRQSLPLICIGKKKDVGCPSPAKCNTASKIDNDSRGTSTIAASRKIQRRVRDMGVVETVADAAGKEERLDRVGFICEAVSLN